MAYTTTASVDYAQNGVRPNLAYFAYRPELSLRSEQ